MDCREFLRQYTAYRDGHDPELAADMDDHIETCPACAGYDRAVRVGVDALRGEQVTPSPDFLARLAGRIASAEPVPDALPPRVSSLAATAAAVLLATLIGLTVRELAVLPTPVAAESPMVVAGPRLLPGIPFVTFDRLPSQTRQPPPDHSDAPHSAAR